MIRLFADDTAMFVRGNDVGLVYNDVKKGLIQLKEWFSCNRLTLNLAKTCYSIYHGPKKKNPRLYDTMALNGQIINRQSCVKYLGLTIDETFNWGQHVSNLAKSLSKYYGIFNKMKHMIPKRHKMTIFNSFVNSKICYGIEIYGSLKDCLCKRLQIICNKLLNIFSTKILCMVQINYIKSWILFR